MVFPFEDSIADANGVIREVWELGIFNIDDFDKEELDESPVDMWHVIQTLAAPVNFGTSYQQKLTAYFQVSVTV